jgi:glyoxylase-like metal-dependent hydrolase (beta-lactamase superfamily II)
MKRITKQVYGVLRYFQFMNFYVIDTGAGFLVVDTGLDKASVPALERGLQALRASISDVKAILITHGHGDHIGGLPALQERLPNIPTYAHELDAPIIRGEAPPVYAGATDLRGLPRLMLGMLPAKLSPSRVDVEVRDVDVLGDLLPGLTVIHLPGP